MLEFWESYQSKLLIPCNQTIYNFLCHFIFSCFFIASSIFNFLHEIMNCIKSTSLNLWSSLKSVRSVEVRFQSVDWNRCSFIKQFSINVWIIETNTFSLLIIIYYLRQNNPKRICRLSAVVIHSLIFLGFCSQPHHFTHYASSKLTKNRCNN